MIQFLDGVDDIRKAKIKEFFEKAEIKARPRPAPKAGAPVKGGKPAATAGTNAPTGTRPASIRPGAAKPGQLKRPTSTVSVDKEPDSPKKPTIARPGVKAPPAPTSRIAARQSMAPPPRTGSPTPKKPVVEEPPAPKLGRGLMGRVLSLEMLLIQVYSYPNRTIHDQSRTRRIRYSPSRESKMGISPRRRPS
jgi:protein STU2